MCCFSGWNDFESIAQYAKTKKDFFKSFLDLESGVPSADTFLDVMNRLNPTQFEKAFTYWVLRSQSLNENVISIDGKTMHGTVDKINGAFPIHLLTASSLPHVICFCQIRVPEKSNEIKAIPKLLVLLLIKGVTVTMDAMG